MKKRLIQLLSVLLCFSICISAGTVSFAEVEVSSSAQEETNKGEEAAELIEQAVLLILSRYKVDVKKEQLYRDALRNIIIKHPELLEDAFRGMFDNLDDYSIYYTEEELVSFLDDMAGEICGIGVLITTTDEGLLVSKVFSESPALEAGLMQGDVITHAGDVSIAGMDIELAKQLITGPEGTEVTISFKRGDEAFTKTLIRKRVNVDAGEYQLVEDSTIGYIKLNEFSNTAAEFVKKALTEFDNAGVKDIIMDLRNNPGGGLSELVDVCSLFIPTGPAIHLEYKNPLRSLTLYAENEDETPKYNLAVLINKNSASASEAFAAAVQDTGVGIVVGETSFGKGTMQNITRFKIGGGVKITEAEYLSPNGRTVNKLGVTPDVNAPDKLSSYARADLETVTYDRILKIGDKGKDVKAIEERLRMLGLSVGVPDEEFDMRTHTATLSFQKSTGLYPYGVMDFTTQTKLESFFTAAEVYSDTSYKKAVEIFKEGNWQEYKQDWSGITEK